MLMVSGLLGQGQQSYSDLFKGIKFWTTVFKG